MTGCRSRSPVGGVGGLAVLTLSALCVVSFGCATVGPPTVDDAQLAEAVADLSRPLPENMAALYGLRVSRTGALRLSVLASGDSGRMTVSQPFGAAVSVTGWGADPPMVFADLKHGCRALVRDLSDVIEVSGLPIHQAIRLLGGRLPALENDNVELESGGRVRIQGRDWAASALIGVEPWRVLEVNELRTDGGDGWRATLDDHARSVPGRIRLTGPDGRWAELDLKAIEWPASVKLPDLPELPVCGEQSE
jgi:hypothetical protein